ncbi:unnamed protein product [Enterobius vermicularis]|uniref:Uncharacterized protein n=1 Tax=Enterobius vermicularis TaxID=51028 RepID=A0A0N4UZU7_ENTVE|nr:unnamed protein product [Enterobius vermicularis]
MHLNCIGTWKGKNDEKYLAVEDEESGQIRCGMLMRLSPEKLVLHMSSNAQCDKLSPNSTYATDTYRFRHKKSQRNLAVCRFPEWLQGGYSDVTINGGKFIYKSSAPESGSAVSYCIDADENRVAVFSETLCEEAVGFHCFWFSSRSDSVVEFKTTGRFDNYKPDLCRNDQAFDRSSWAAMVAAKPDSVSCGYTGIYESPTKSGDSECYRMTVDCKQNSIMKVTAYECSTGITHDTTCAEKPKKPDSIKKLEVNEDIKDVRTVQGVSNVNVTNRRYYPSNKNVSYYRTVVYSKAPLSYLSVHLLPVIVILAVL